MNRAVFPAIVLSIFISACSTARNRVPSLLPRTIETTGKAMLEEPPAELVALTASEPLRVARVQFNLEKAQATIQPFTSAISVARNLVGGGHAYGSEAWVQALVALARAEAAHGPTVKALSELDEEMRVLMDAARSSDEATVIGAIKQVEGIERSQSSQIQALYSQMGL